jgi:hypothetical protein
MGLDLIKSELKALSNLLITELKPTQSKLEELQPQLDELANLLMKEEYNFKNIEKAKLTAKYIDKKMKIEFLRSMFGGYIGPGDGDLPPLPTMVDNMIYLWGMVGDGFRKIVEKYPSVLKLSSDEMKKKFEYLQGLGVDNVGEFLEEYPELFGYNIDLMNENIKYLQNLVGYNNVVEVVKKYTRAIGYDAGYIDEIVKYIQNLGVNNVGKVVERCPEIFGAPTSYMDQVVKYIQNLGVNNVGKVVEEFPQVLVYTKVLEKFPQVLVCSTYFMNQNVEFLKKNLGVNNVGKVVENFPQVLLYNTDEIKEYSGYIKNLDK